MFQKINRIFQREGVCGVFRASAQRFCHLMGRHLLDWEQVLALDPNILLNIEQKKVLGENQIFKGRHVGRRCFVIGNGPSINGQDLTPLKDEVTFAMSAFWKHPIIEKWQPTYYCFADPIYFNEDPAEIRFFKELSQRIQRSHFFVPLVARPVVQKLKLFSSQPVSYLNLQGNLSQWQAPLNLTQTIPGVPSVAQLAIMMAMYMGCSPIFLLGLDHDWLSHRGEDRHFYQGQTMDGHPIATGRLDYSYYSEILSMEALWKGYYQLAQWAPEMNVQIVNATRGGFLDVFERIEYEKLVGLPFAGGEKM